MGRKVKTDINEEALNKVAKWRLFLDRTLPEAAEKAKKDGHALAAILIQTNLVEFYLAQLLFGINFYVRKHARRSQVSEGLLIVIPRVAAPRIYKKQRYTLGMLIRELQKFEFLGSKKLVSSLKTFNKHIRPLFVHNLADPEHSMSKDSLNKISSVAYGLAKELTEIIKEQDRRIWKNIS